ncbi:DUF4350 domain-containing protein [Pseudosporangium ferrugineum]|uniref:DUF4350 domain-containing protein n=1 Tax=Pseudosporangium ferrugineum TaxID=439699 RepID=A0A2T0R967_9ACTN|nr:DUF4350 domain-containing protein [Pseudosporangium ferrugineum]PRY17685.1 hypothetical protein CLV70_15011 [Pseudosporangium ferrugineum]
MKNPRRLRLVAPLAAVLALATFTGIVHAVEQPDPTDAAFLSPTSDEGEGARLLADGLAREGIVVDVRRTTPEALDAVGSGEAATVFVTAPALVYRAYLERLVTLPAQVRVVMVAPTESDLRQAGLDVPVGGPRWTAAAPPPGCAAGFADAGPAAALRRTYDAGAYEPVVCYGGGVAEFQARGYAELTLVGAADPFRNDRADEHGNRRLALGLLSRTPRVVWLDLHERERAPRPTPTPTRPADPGEPEDEGYEDWTDDGGRGDGPGQPTPAPAPDGEGDGGSQGGALGDSALAQAFPPAVWATLALLVLAAVALVLASARRLGAPVAEPLPVRVRAAETVRGLGGLYRRAGARGTSLATVQSAARARLLDHFGLPPDTPIDPLAARVAAYTGVPEDDVRHLLGGGVEDSDEELVRAATAVQDLVRHVTGQQNWQQAPDEGNVT